MGLSLVQCGFGWLINVEHYNLVSKECTICEGKVLGGTKFCV